MPSNDPDDPNLAAYLSNVIQLCPVCSYELIGLHGSRCPECGSAIRITVGASPHPLISLSLAACWASPLTYLSRLGQWAIESLFTTISWNSSIVLNNWIVLVVECGISAIAWFGLQKSKYRLRSPLFRALFIIMIVRLVVGRFIWAQWIWL